MTTKVASLLVRLVLAAIVVGQQHLSQAQFTYNATWSSLDKRPLPDWYDKAKFGIFIHWGVFSVPSYGSEWIWWNWQGDNPDNGTVDFMKNNYPPDFTYADFGPQFHATFYDPNWWADLMEASGAKYVVLTSKHHEGYTMWPSSVSFNWNSMDVGPRRDLVGDFADAIRNRTDLHFGLYHSLFEWFNPMYLTDKENNFTTTYFPERKTIPELVDIVNTYRPDVIWSDGDWEAPDWYWGSTKFLAWLYNESPVKDTVVTNDRWGYEIMCQHGGFLTCSDRYNPGVLQPRKWENCMTIDKHSWGFRRNAAFQDYMTIEEILASIASTVSCGGNILMNVGPTADGFINPIFEERLRQVGQWMSVNGEAIYESVPWKHQNDTLNENVWYTSNGATVYAVVLQWPSDNLVALGSVVPTPKTHITLLGYNEPLLWSPEVLFGGIVVQLPIVIPSQLPSQWAWTLKMTGIEAYNETDFLLDFPEVTIQNVN